MATYTHFDVAVPGNRAWVGVMQPDPPVVGDPTDTLVVIENSDGTETRIIGHDFTFDSNGPTGGTVTEVQRIFSDGTLIEQITDFNVPLATLVTATTGGQFFNPIMSGVDTLFGGSGNDFLLGGNGGDALHGGAGSDWADYITQPGATGVTVDLTGNTPNTGFAVGDTYDSIENIRGSHNNDTLIGDDGNNFLRGAEGADTLIGNGGTDIADYFGASTGVTADLSNSLNNSAGTDADGDTYDSIEGLRGTAFADHLIGNAGNNVLTGDAGNDVLDGGAGNDEVRYDLEINTGGTHGVVVNLGAGTGTATDAYGFTDTLIGIEGVRGTNLGDTLNGGGTAGVYSFEFFRGLAGDDTISGGDGYDELRYDLDANAGGGNGVTVNLGDGTATDGFGSHDTVSGIQGVRGTAFVDHLTGSTNIGFYGESFSGLAGADIIDGGGGFDEVRYDADSSFGGPDGVTVNLAEGTAIDGFGDTDQLTGIEGARGTSQVDTFIGSAADNRFYGFAGDDAIDGGDGSDTVRYDRDADFGGNLGVVVDLGAGTATDGFGNHDQLTSIEGADGTSHADSLTGSDADNTFAGYAGDDVIDGGAGTDEVRYVADLLYGGTLGVTVDLGAGTATDGFGNHDQLTSIENVRGSRFGDTLIGSDGDNAIAGLAGDDDIRGGAGSDWAVYAYDIFYREESEVMGAVTVDLGAGTATDGYGGHDTLTDIENVAGGSLGDTLTGSAGDNIFRGLAGDDIIDGLGGIDTVDYSADARYGNALFVDGSAGVTVDLGAGTATDGFGGHDTLGNIENAIGTASADTLAGSTADNVLTGGGGNDALDGGAGDDTAVYRGNLADYSFSGTADSFTVTDGTADRDGTDTVHNVEFLTFADGTFSVADLLPEPPTGGAPHDFNGDGTSDILVRNEGSGYLSYGAVNGGSLAWTGLDSLSPAWGVLGVGDFDGDGHAGDLLVTEQGTNYISYGAVTNGSVSWTGLDFLASGWEFQGTGDFNSDGNDDFLVRNTSSGYLSYGAISGGSVSWQGLDTLPPGWNVEGVGDFDGDGHSDDVLVEEANTGYVAIGAVTNGSIGWSGLDFLPAGWDIKGVGDFNADGTDDFLVQNTTTGDLSYGAISGGSLTWLGLDSLTLDWDVVSAGDFDGDGVSNELLVHNETTDYISYGSVANGSITWHGLTTLPDGWFLMG